MRRLCVLGGSLAAIAVLLALSGLVRPPFVGVFRVSGRSMQPTLADGDRLLVTSLPPLERGDLVVVEIRGEVLVKRLVGLPGDRIEARGGTLSVDGRPLEIEGARPPADFGPLVLGEDEYFLLGDNAPVSVDSRIFGPVHGGDVLGEVVWTWHEGRGRPSAAARSRR